MSNEQDWQCYCEDLQGWRKCSFCKTRELRAEEDKVCQSWNWNNTPRECAAEARERDWSVSQVGAAMLRNGFQKSQIAQVLHEMEIGE